MKKVYEAPKMLIETVCAEEMLTASIAIKEDVEVTNLDELLTKDRDDNAWGGLW